MITTTDTRSLLRNEEQQELQLHVKKAIDTHAPMHRIRVFAGNPAEHSIPEFEDSLFQQLGIGGLGISEQLGGSGEGMGEIIAVLEELGRGLVPSSFLSTTAICGQALQRFDASDSVTATLKAIAAGDAVISYGPLTPGPEQVTNAEGRLTGVVLHALDALHADMLLVEARDATGTPEFHLVSPQSAGVRVRPLVSMDPTRKVGRVELTDVESTPLSSPDIETVTRDIDAIAALSLAAEQLGGLLAAVESTVEYSRIRVQFGRTIGSYQAIKHRLADMHVIGELATALVRAAVSAENSATEFITSAHAAHAYLSRSFMQVSREMIQLHGGVGFTWEHEAHLFFKRANSSGQLLGGPDRHEEIVAGLLGHPPVIGRNS